MFLQITIISFLQNLSSYLSQEIIIFFARYLAWFFCILLILFIMQEIIFHVFKRQSVHLRKVLFAIIMSSGIAFFVQWLSKFLISSGRPFTVGVYSYYEYGGYDSFPSGHALVFMALAITVFKYHKLWGSFFIACAVIIGIFRVVAGIHWPVDVVVGWILGLMVGLLSVQFIKKTIS